MNAMLCRIGGAMLAILGISAFAAFFLKDRSKRSDDLERKRSLKIYAKFANPGDSHHQISIQFTVLISDTLKADKSSK
jgi:hypothetical protein